MITKLQLLLLLKYQIFTEEAVDKRASQVIANEIGGKVLTLSPQEVGNSQTDYIKKMEDNLSHLKEALCN